VRLEVSRRSDSLAALEALKGDVTIAGTSGFTTREDVLLATTSPDKAKLVKTKLRGA
jgi:hypothetical protein